MLTSRLRPEQLKEFEQKVQQAAGKLPEEVVRIRHSFGEDWSGDLAIYFRIVLSDEASRLERLWESSQRVRKALEEDLRLYESDYWPYFNFRSKSEEDKLREPD
jgi:hypothetical protein